MSEINLTESVKSSLRAIDESKLRDLIYKATSEGRMGDLYHLPLSGCGFYVASKLNYFAESLRRYNDAKSAKNREDKRYSAMRAGDDLSFSVMQMKKRMEQEEEEGKLFRIDDNIIWPWRFGKKLEVRISYRWRGGIGEEWQSGSIVFIHEVTARYVYDPSPPTRKPSAARQAEKLQEELGSTWQNLMRSAICSVRDFFREGGDGCDIPDVFQAIPDSYSGGLNNFSTIFWKTKP